MNLDPIFILFSILILFSLVIYAKFKASYLNPLSLYLLPAWGYLAISHLYLASDMTPLNETTWLILVGSWMSFILGVAMVQSSFQKPYNTNLYKKISESFQNYNWRRHLILTSILFSLSTLAFAYIFITIGGTILFNSNAGKLVHGQLQLPMFLVNFYFACLIPITLAIMGSFKSWNQDKKLRNIFLVLSIAFFFISFLFWPTRFLLIISLLALLCFRELNGYRISLIMAFILPFIGIGLFLLILELQGYHAISQLIMPYKYIANNFWNLDYALEKYNSGHGHPHTWGLTTFSGIAIAIPVFGNIWDYILQAFQFDTMFNESNQKVQHLNTISYQWSLFKDFGYVGVYTFSFLWGGFMQWLWLKIHTKPRPVNIICYAVLSFYLFHSTFMAVWTQAINVVLLIGSMLVVYVCQPQLKKQ
jgi:oligosaccharide repeat unit polymerase